MPHVVVQYTANLDPEAQIGALCKALAEIMWPSATSAGARVFPIGGTRVLAYPAPHFAVADGARRPRLRVPQPAHRARAASERCVSSAPAKR